jgi:hypothetical protein
MALFQICINRFNLVHKLQVQLLTFHSYPRFNMYKTAFSLSLLHLSNWYHCSDKNFKVILGLSLFLLSMRQSCHAHLQDTYLVSCH